MEILSDLREIQKWCEANPKGVLVSTKINRRWNTYTEHKATCAMFYDNFPHPHVDAPYYCYVDKAELKEREGVDGVVNRRPDGRKRRGCY